MLANTLGSGSKKVAKCKDWRNESIRCSVFSLSTFEIAWREGRKGQSLLYYSSVMFQRRLYYTYVYIMNTCKNCSGMLIFTLYGVVYILYRYVVVSALQCIELCLVWAYVRCIGGY